MKLYMIEYTWDDMPHGDIIPLPDDPKQPGYNNTEHLRAEAKKWLHENVADDTDEDEDGYHASFTIDSVNEVTDMIDSQGNGALTGATVEQCEDMLRTVLAAYHAARKLPGDARGFAAVALAEVQIAAGEL